MNPQTPRHSIVYGSGKRRAAPKPIDNSHLNESLERACVGVEYPGGADGVTDGTRTRNIQNHNLGLYH